MLTLEFSDDRNAPDVCDQPSVQMHNWRVFDLQMGDKEVRVLVGFPYDNDTVRTTSPLQSITPARRVVTTSSGREYELLGPPTENPQRLLFIHGRVALSGRPAKDVSQEIWTYMQSGLL